MKKIFTIQLVALMAALVCSCSGNKTSAPEFVTDEYGVVEKINPQNKEVYLVFTGHYLSSHSYAHLLLCSEEDRNISLVSEDSLRADFAIMENRLERYGLKKEQYCWLIPPYEVYDQKAVDVMKDMSRRIPSTV